MAIRVTPRWHAGESDLDGRLLPLLRGISGTGSLNRAVAALGLSYRHAWGLIGKMERALGQALVSMERGRGARLTDYAKRLLAADDVATDVLGRELAAAVQALNRPTARAAPRSRPLVVHASHDLALAALRDTVAESGGAFLELHFQGSLDSLAGLARGDCDLAGFHVPGPAAEHGALMPYARFLSIRSLRLVRFVGRRQGLIVARGNPLRLRGFGDIAGRGARLINRQAGSGTRLCFDRLLSAAGLRPAQIKGYAIEEFTHAAVAATVASGMADVGFGIEAAARRHDLDFVPLAAERYYLAARAAVLARRETRALLDAMKEPAFLARLGELPGYDLEGVGSLTSVSEVLRAPR